MPRPIRSKYDLFNVIVEVKVLATLCIRFLLRNEELFARPRPRGVAELLPTAAPLFPEFRRGRRGNPKSKSLFLFTWDWYVKGCMNFTWNDWGFNLHWQNDELDVILKKQVNVILKDMIGQYNLHDITQNLWTVGQNKYLLIVNCIAEITSSRILIWKLRPSERSKVNSHRFQYS